MFIRLSRYIIIGLIISLVAYLVTENSGEKIDKQTLLTIGVSSAVIIFAISFRVEFYENTDVDMSQETTVAEVGEKQEPLIPQQKSEKIDGSESSMTEVGVDISDKERIRKIAIEMIEKIDIPGTEDDEEVMMKVEKMVRQEMGLEHQKEKQKMADKIAERVMHPTQEELKVQKKPVENRLSMQYEKPIEDVIKEKIREQLYSKDIIQRRKESDYVIMPVSEWSLPLERNHYKCIPKEQDDIKEPCACGPGEGSGFWDGSFMKIKGAKQLPPSPKKLNK